MVAQNWICNVIPVVCVCVCIVHKNVNPSYFQGELYVIFIPIYKLLHIFQILAWTLGCHTQLYSCALQKGTKSMEHSKSWAHALPLFREDDFFNSQNATMKDIGSLLHFYSQEKNNIKNIYTYQYHGQISICVVPKTSLQKGYTLLIIKLVTDMVFN